jgi:hypothetical protein
MTQGKRGVVQAADFLIKEARKLKQGIGVGRDKYADSLLDEAEALFLSTKEEQQVAELTESEWTMYVLEHLKELDRSTGRRFVFSAADAGGRTSVDDGVNTGALCGGMRLFLRMIL